MRWRRRRASWLLAAVVVVAGLSGCGGGPRLAAPAMLVEPRLAAPEPAAGIEPGPEAPRGDPTPPPLPALVADAVVPRVTLYSQPGGGPTRTLTNPTHELQPLILFVRDQVPGWYRVQMPVRPNESTAWVPADQVQVRKVDTGVVVELEARRLTAWVGSSVALQVPVAVGTGGTPTPVGNFYIDAIAGPLRPGGPYGPWQLSLAAFSDVLKSFGGGNGQIAMHGTNNPGAVGSPVSHGCVRLTNDAITRLQQIAPLGTPVNIVE